MERLTKRIDGSVVFPNELIGKTVLPDNTIMHGILHRLAAYEDTGLMPEEIIKALKTLDLFIEATNGIPLNRIREFVQAEKDGRLVEPPEVE